MKNLKIKTSYKEKSDYFYKLNNYFKTNFKKSGIKYKKELDEIILNINLQFDLLECYTKTFMEHINLLKMAILS